MSEDYNQNEDGGETNDDGSEIAWEDPAFEAAVPGELDESVDTGTGEELVAWKETDGPPAIRMPDPPTGDGPAVEIDESDLADPVDVRSEILDDVRAYFADGDVDDGFAPTPDDTFVEERWFDFDYLDEFEEVERKWVNEPYAYVSVLYNDDRKEFRYHVVEPVLDEFEDYVRQDLTQILRNSLMYHDLEEDRDRATLFEEEAKDIIAEHAATVEGGSLYKLLYYLTRDFVDYAQIDPMMRDDDIEDVSCDGVDIPVFVYHREYRDLKSNVRFTKNTLDSMTIKLAQRAGKNISVSDPLVDASLPDGSRIQLTLGGEISTRGSNFTIRKFSDIPMTPIDLIEFNTFSVDEMAYFWLAIENNKSLIFAGGTGSGKTTSMNAVSMFIPPGSKVVSIEDTREITLPHDNWIQSVTRTAISEGGRGEVNMYELLQASLRQRPEYIIVGEIRTEQRVALTFFQAIGTGHTAYTTIHADSIEGALARLQNDPLSVPAQMIKNLDIVSIQRQIRTEDTRVRRNQSVVEILPGGDGEEVLTHAVFARDPRDDIHHQENDSRVLEEIKEDRGWDDEQLQQELALRKEVLEYMLNNDITAYADVTALIQTFAKDPGYVIERIRSGGLDVESIEESIDDGDADTPDSGDESDADAGADSVDDGTEPADGVADASDEPADDVADASDEPADGEFDDDADGGEIEDEAAPSTVDGEGR